jgi:hypothetical protein
MLATATNNLIRSLGMTAAGAVIGAVLAATRTGLSTPTLGGFHTTLVITAVVAVLAVAISLTVPKPSVLSAADGH